MGTIDRYRDKNGDIGHEVGTTSLRTLRDIYGHSFAPGYSANATLADVLWDIDEFSLRLLVNDHQAGTLLDKVGGSTLKATG